MTKTATGTVATQPANFGFSAFVFALFGWINLEAFLLETRAGISAHLLTAVFGTSLSLLAYRRCRAWRTPPAPSWQDSAMLRRSTAGIGSGAALIAAGCALAYSMRSGFATTTVICAAILCFFPWSRIGFCRKHFFVSHTLLLAGWLPVLLSATTHPPVIMLMAASWVVWTLAAGLLAITLFSHRSTVKHAAGAGAESSGTLPSIHALTPDDPARPESGSGAPGREIPE